MRDELYRPLGQNLAPRVTAVASNWPRRLGFASLSLLLLAGSATLALRQPDFSPPPAPTAPKTVEIAAASTPEPSIVRGGQGSSPVTISRGSETPWAAGSASIDDTQTGSIRVFDPNSLRQPPAVADRPDEALIEDSAFGPLPVRSGDGRRPLDVYAGASSGAAGTRIALVVGGLGISQTGTQRAVQQLPAGVTLAFAANGNSLDRWMTTARRGGHELLLQAPLEPFGFADETVGETMLTVDDARAGRFQPLDRAMARLTNYVGIVNYMGARFNSDPTALEPFLAEIGRRGLLYMDDGSSSRSQSKDVAMASRVPFAQSEMTLDEDRAPDAIRRQLDALERVARAKGTAIGIASAFETSVDTISAWIEEASARGIEIVPVSALAFDPERG